MKKNGITDGGRKYYNIYGVVKRKPGTNVFQGKVCGNKSRNGRQSLFREL